jgi:ribosomal protein L11 methyltransferase
LKALSLSARRERPLSVLDLGCGSGVLAIAAAKLWRWPVIATDIDPIAVAVARENCRSNGVAPLVRAAVADGLEHPAIRARAPYELILANILASPLARLAPALSAALALGGTAVLSGLLRSQESQVLSYYRAQGLVFRQALRDGPWSALVLQRAGR